MKKIPIPILSVAATAAIVVTACGTPRTIRDVGPSSFTTLSSPSTTCTQPPGAPPCPGGAGVWRPTNAETAVWAAKRFGADRIDVAAATVALDAGRPFLVGLPDGPEPACHTALLVPGDPAPWILNRSGAAPTAGMALSRDRDGYGCGRTRPRGVTTAVPVPNPPLNQAAKAAAQREGKPFLYGETSCDGSTTITSVVLPTGKSWTTNRAGEVPAEGIALSDVAYGSGCTADNPTTPKGN